MSDAVHIFMDGVSHLTGCLHRSLTLMKELDHQVNEISRTIEKKEDKYLDKLNNKNKKKSENESNNSSKEENSLGTKKNSKSGSEGRIKNSHEKPDEEDGDVDGDVDGDGDGDEDFNYDEKKNERRKTSGGSIKLKIKNFNDKQLMNEYQAVQAVVRNMKMKIRDLEKNEEMGTIESQMELFNIETEEKSPKRNALEKPNAIDTENLNDVNKDKYKLEEHNKESNMMRMDINAYTENDCIDDDGNGKKTRGTKRKIASAYNWENKNCFNIDNINELKDHIRSESGERKKTRKRHFTSDSESSSENKGESSLFNNTNNKSNENYTVNNEKTKNMIHEEEQMQDCLRKIKNRREQCSAILREKICINNQIAYMIKQNYEKLKKQYEKLYAEMEMTGESPPDLHTNYYKHRHFSEIEDSNVMNMKQRNVPDAYNTYDNYIFNTINQSNSGSNLGNNSMETIMVNGLSCLQHNDKQNTHVINAHQHNIEEQKQSHSETIEKHHTESTEKKKKESKKGVEEIYMERKEVQEKVEMESYKKEQKVGEEVVKKTVEKAVEKTIPKHIDKLVEKNMKKFVHNFVDKTGKENKDDKIISKENKIPQKNEIEKDIKKENEEKQFVTKEKEGDEKLKIGTEKNEEEENKVKDDGKNIRTKIHREKEKEKEKENKVKEKTEEKILAESELVSNITEEMKHSDTLKGILNSYDKLNQNEQIYDHEYSPK